MSKAQLSEVFNMAHQIIPFLMITAMLIVVTYTYGYTVQPSSLDTSFDLSKLNFVHYY